MKVTTFLGVTEIVLIMQLHRINGANDNSIMLSVLRQMLRHLSYLLKLVHSIHIEVYI